MGKLKGDLPGLDVDQAIENVEDENLAATEFVLFINCYNRIHYREKPANVGGWFSAFKSLVGTKQLNKEEIEPVLEKMREVLISKSNCSFIWIFGN